MACRSRLLSQCLGPHPWPPRNYKTYHEDTKARRGFTNELSHFVSSCLRGSPHVRHVVRPANVFRTYSRFARVSLTRSPLGLDVSSTIQPR